MNKSFPRNITLLRKEKKLTQKKVAEDLGISQALLSHYEKGVRECSLDFVVRIAEYYHVSSDYLLGLTVERNFEEAEPVDVSSRNTGSVSSIGKRLTESSADIIFDLLAKAGNRRLSRIVTSYMLVVLYRVFRCLYSARGDNPEDIFAVPKELYKGYSCAAQEKLYTELIAMCVKDSASYTPAVKKLMISPDTLAEDYPTQAPALFNMIQQAENIIK